LIKFTENIIPSPIQIERTTTFDLFCGAIVSSNTGYCNYVLDDLYTLTDNDYQNYYMCEDFLNYSNNLKIFRPINTTNIANTSITFDLTTINKLGDVNYYNPTKALETINNTTLTETLKLITKYVREFDDEYNITISICSSLSTFYSPIFSDGDLTVFDSSLLNIDGNLRSYNEIVSTIPDFANNDFIILILEKEDDVYKLSEQFTVNYDETDELFVESILYSNSNLLYGKRGTNLNKIETTTHTTTECKNENYVNLPVSSTDFTLVQADYEETLAIINSDTTIKGVISFEFNADPNLVANNVTNENIFNFVSLYDASKYINKADVVSLIINDYNPNSAYFNTFRNNTILIGNMYRKYDETTAKHRYIPTSGILAGLVFEKELKEPIDLNDYISNDKLLFSPTDVERVNLLNNNINNIINYREQNYIFGNKCVNDKLSLTNIHNAGIINVLKYQIQEIATTYNNLKNKKIEKKEQRVYNDIEKVLKGLYKYISNNSIQVLYDNNTLTFVILVWLRDLIDSFEIEINININ